MKNNHYLMLSEDIFAVALVFKPILVNDCIPIKIVLKLICGLYLEIFNSNVLTKLRLGAVNEASF